MDSEVLGGGAEAPTAPRQLRIFINYRHEDTDGDALLLHERLAARFGAENVFLDRRTLRPGMNWLEEIKAHQAISGVFLALIGQRWAALMQMRAQQAAVHPGEDYVRFEIEHALRPGSGVEVIPVIVGRAATPTTAGLPRSLYQLTRIEAEQLRHDRFDEDVAHLISTIEELVRSEHGVTHERVQVAPPIPEPIAGVAARPGESLPEPADGVAPVPDERHFELVRRQLSEGNLVWVLGPRLNRGGGGQQWQAGCGLPPDADDLATSLAELVSAPNVRLDLAAVAQYVYETQGKADLYRPLSRILSGDCEPGPVHRFLARLPQALERLGVEQRYQLIVTTNFDIALERAFEEAGEEYDLAVYMASGPDKGKFVHFPSKIAMHETVTVANMYAKFPIGDYGELERPVIVKIHGAVDGSFGDFRWKENYVITEDHYIDYLSRSPVENLVPMQILDKLRDSHCLFLGYTMRDWYVRVFMKRIWSDQQLGANSWAIEPDADALEKEFWTHANVDLYAAQPAEYVAKLRERLASPRAHAPRNA